MYIVICDNYLFCNMLWRNLIYLFRYGKILFQPENNEGIHYRDLSGKPLTPLEDIYEDWAKDYSIKARAQDYYPLDLYCGDYFRVINGYLRNFHEDFFALEPVDESKKVNELSEIIFNAPRIPFDIVVYRGVYSYFTRRLINNNRKGKYTIEKGFMSTTATFDSFFTVEELRSFQDILKIYVPKGRPGVYVEQVRTPFMTGRDEHEILFLPNTRLGMTRYPYKVADKTIYECIML